MAAHARRISTSTRSRSRPRTSIIITGDTSSRQNTVNGDAEAMKKVGLSVGPAGSCGPKANGTRSPSRCEPDKKRRRGLEYARNLQEPDAVLPADSRAGGPVAVCWSGGSTCRRPSKLERPRGSCASRGKPTSSTSCSIDPDRPNHAGQRPGGPRSSRTAGRWTGWPTCARSPPATARTRPATSSFPAARNARMRRVKLTDVGIVQAAKFLSTMQSMWVTAHSARTSSSKKKGMPDQWDVDFSFLYYY